jgi:hypothetical protein
MGFLRFLLAGPLEILLLLLLLVGLVYWWARLNNSKKFEKGVKATRYKPEGSDEGDAPKSDVENKEESK